MSKRIRSKRFKSKKAKSKNAKSKRDYKKTMNKKSMNKKSMNRRRKNKIKKINKGGSSVIGQGAYGTVELYAQSVSGYSRKACFARKIAKRDLTPDENGAFAREFEILERMNHSNIVKVFRMGRTGLNFYLEFCNAGDLYHYIKNGQAQVNDGCLEDSNGFAHETIMGGGYKTMDTDQKFFVIQGILKGLKYIHANEYIHCDIKPGNILLTYNSDRRHNYKFTPKIADFGLAARSGDKKAGTNKYIPVECLVRTGESHDYWGCGMTILEFIRMSTGLSTDYIKCISPRDYKFNIIYLSKWWNKYFGDDLRRTMSVAHARASFRTLLCIPTHVELEELGVEMEGNIITLSESTERKFYEHYANIRKRGFNALCELYDTR